MSMEKGNIELFVVQNDNKRQLQNAIFNNEC